MGRISEAWPALAPPGDCCGAILRISRSAFFSANHRPAGAALRLCATRPAIKGLQTAALAIARQIDVFNAATNRDIDTVFASLVQKRIDALLVIPDPLFANRRVQLVTLATHHRVPAIYFSRELAEIGGLMSYGTSQTDMYRQVGIYVGRILKGEKPADLPVLRATRFELVINLQTARTLGLEVPPTLLALADEVIE